MQPFPDPKPNLLAPDADLQTAFDNAIASAANPPRNAPIVIVAINDEPPHGFAGQRLAEVHYSASLLKVVAMYTAFELRKAANDLLLAAPPAPSDVFATLKTAFNDVIDLNRVAQLSGVNLTGFLLPRWEEIFQVDAATSTVNFSAAFSGHLFDAIAKGDNAAAGKVVHSLGFGYLTKATAEAGFFDPSAASAPATADGMWLCGDFGFGFPPQRIPCVNDTPVAQATSVMQMARLFTGLAGPTVLVDVASDTFMLELLQAAVVRLHLFLNRDTSVQFVTTQSKIGLGPLNSGATVASEAAVIQENSTGRRFVVVFQNQPFVNDASIKPVSGVVDATIASFLFP
jgi:hypothetical protein